MSVRSGGRTSRKTYTHDSRANRRSGQMSTIISLCKMKRNDMQLCKFVTGKMHKMLHRDNSWRTQSGGKRNLKNRRKPSSCVSWYGITKKKGMNLIKLPQCWGNKITNRDEKERIKETKETPNTITDLII